MNLSKKQVFIASIILVFLFSSHLYAKDAHFKNLRLGITYSPIQSRYLGQDQKQAYLDVLNMGFDIIRLGAYWKDIEKEKDEYDFSNLDWQISQAKKKRIPVILTVGMKAPRWPEYFIPEWVLKEVTLPAGSDVSKSDYLKRRTLIFIRKVLEHYNNERAICYWQVENEPLNHMGEKSWYIGNDFLKEEISLVRKMDKRNRPIIVNLATYPNKFLRYLNRLLSPNNPIQEAIELCDILGLNVYPVVGHSCLGFDFRFRTHARERKEYLKGIINHAKAKGKTVWVTELQAEPWEPGKLVHVEKDSPTTSSPQSYKLYVDELESLGIETILLWGAEYWYFRRTCHLDNLWWETALKLLNKK